MSRDLQKSERRKEQNRRAQANLRRKRQDRIEDLQRQIRSLQAQAQASAVEQSHCQHADRGDGGEILDFVQDDGSNSFQANMGEISSYLTEHNMLANNIFIPFVNPCSSYVPQLPTPPNPPSHTAESPVSSGLRNLTAGKTAQITASTDEQHHCAFDALSKNAVLLGISPESFLSTHSNSIFYSPLQSLDSILTSIQHVPPEFHPTVAQLSYPHQPWIDCIPLRDLRSRIIFAASHRPPFLDSLELWHDVLSDGLSCASDPMNAQLWSMSDGFMQRWQILLKFDLVALETMCLATNPPIRKISLPGS